MKRTSVSFEATDVQSAARNANAISAVFDRHLLMVGLWVFAGYYLGCKIGFALTFQPHPISVLWPPNSIVVAALLLTPPVCGGSCCWPRSLRIWRRSYRVTFHR